MRNLPNAKFGRPVRVKRIDAHLVDPVAVEFFENRAPSEQDRAPYFNVGKLFCPHPSVNGSDRFANPSRCFGFV